MPYLVDYSELPVLSEYVTVADFQAQGVDFSKPDASGAYPLQAICESLTVHYVSDLIQAGADVNVKDKCGRTPLLSTIECCHFDPDAAVKILEILLDNDADIECRGEWDVTPFLKSCTRGEVKVTQCLIDRGCDINATANEVGGKMDSKGFCDMPGISSEFREFIHGLYPS